MHTKGQMLREDRFMYMLTEDDKPINKFSCSIQRDNGGIITEGEAVDNARRIVALWNMADRLNLSTEFIENDGVDEMVEFIETIERIAAKSNIPLMQHEARNILSKWGGS